MKQWVCLLPAYTTPAAVTNPIISGDISVLQDPTEPFRKFWEIDLKGLPTRYLGTATGITSISSGALFLVYQTQTNVSGVNTCGFGLSYCSRVTYYDA